MATTDEILQMMDEHSANNYYPLPIVIHMAEGVWVEDLNGHRYMDMLSAYSALNHGHRHPKIMQALQEQAGKVTLTSRAFQSEAFGIFVSKLAAYTGKDKILAMNTGAEAVETALKMARRWGYRIKGIPENQAEIIVCTGNFHGRTLSVTSFSSEEAYKRDFGPFTPGFRIIPYGDASALEQAITPNTAAFLVEPIQGEAGIVMPPEGYLTQVRELCRRHQVLLMADEIQTGLGRTGRRFACDWEGVVPDVYILGKALGGGVLPVSAVAADREIMDVFEPGSHGSTFGGNPLASTVAAAALEVLEEEKLAERAETLGRLFMKKITSISHPDIVSVRGRGLLIGLQLSVAARPYCEALARIGLLCKETHDTTIRFAPPLILSEEELEFALSRIGEVFTGQGRA
ncbi:ornithine--oxo-acid transaminase [Paenibacillus rhizosphaerae]|uniref:ornithine aminotransferase n=1 Tax=Paenibacillus rhizosphaerae TaxID=297318 RepID=A0A1R1E937_9BACL|nr:ornithine--oxo-acid transaminase [Paenibacillus rhizosphaerae]OMF48345.1 ornithine--oxo-acid transaminase [Paenibacillus rhizosphaerae]